MQTSTSVLLAVVLATLLFSQISADATVPNYPPATQFQVNVTYEPGLYSYDKQQFTGLFHYNSDLQRYSVIAKDAVRTSEVALFWQDNNVQYIMSEFGEFGFDCQTFPKNNYTGGPFAFIPTFGVDFKTATYLGQNSCGSQQCDVFVIKTQNRVGTFYFQAGSDPNRLLVRVEESTADVKRSADFSNWQITQQDQSFFKIPPKSNCAH